MRKMTGEEREEMGSSEALALQLRLYSRFKMLMLTMKLRTKMRCRKKWGMNMMIWLRIKNSR